MDKVYEILYEEDIMLKIKELIKHHNELVEGYNEIKKRYDDLCKVIGFFGSQYDKLVNRLEVLKILERGELKAEDSK